MLLEIALGDYILAAVIAFFITSTISSLSDMAKDAMNPQDEAYTGEEELRILRKRCTVVFPLDSTVIYGTEVHKGSMVEVKLIETEEGQKPDELILHGLFSGADKDGMICVIVDKKVVVLEKCEIRRITVLEDESH